MNNQSYYNAEVLKEPFFTPIYKLITGELALKYTFDVEQINNAPEDKQEMLKVFWCYLNCNGNRYNRRDVYYYLRKKFKDILLQDLDLIESCWHRSKIEYRVSKTGSIEEIGTIDESA